MCVGVGVSSYVQGLEWCLKFDLWGSSQTAQDKAISKPDVSEGFPTGAMGRRSSLDDAYISLRKQR